MLGMAFDTLQARYNAPTETGPRTGFEDIDRIIGDLQPEELIIVGGRPSSGKSTLAMNICEHVSLRYRKPAIIFTMEASDLQIGFRMLASIGRVDLQNLRDRNLADENLLRVSAAIRQLSDAPLFIDSTPALTPSALYTKAAAAKEEHGIGLVVVDYLHLMQTQDGLRNEAEQLAEISRSLKAMAKELQVTVIAISQLNRSPLHRVDRRPQSSDLRGAGSLEDDADIILLLHCPDPSTDPGLTEILVSKCRRGLEGIAQLRFFRQYARFDSLLEREQQPSSQSPAKGAAPEKGPFNALYLSKVLELGLSEAEMLAYLEGVGLVIVTGTRWEPTEMAKPFLHPSPIGGRIWQRRVIEFLRSSR